MTGSELEVRDVREEYEDEALGTEPALELLGEAEEGEVLEVAHLWDDVLMDTRHFRRGDQEEVGAGASLGWRWTALGADLGWVESPWRHLAGLVPLTEVHQEPRQAFWLPGRERELARWEEGGLVALVDDEATIQQDGADMSPAAAAKQGLAIPEGQGWAVRLAPGITVLQPAAGSTFVCRAVRASTRVDRPVTRLDPVLAGIMGTVGALALALVAVVTTAPPSERIPEVSEAVAAMVMSMPDPDPIEEEEVEEEEVKRPEKKVERKETSRRRHQVRDQRTAEAVENMAAVQDSGVFRAFGEGGGLDGLMGTGLSADVIAGVSGLVGVKGGPQTGLMSRGGSLGGGGQFDGIGGMRTSGCVGVGCYGDNQGHVMGEKTDGKLDPGENAIILGNIEKWRVDEVVRQHLSQVRYCYQRQLQREPDLSGKVVIKFVIASDGSVSRAETKESTVQGDSVEACVEQRFYRMKFPMLEGGGIAIVSYPFLFAPG